jgi:low temperature requirement protein LtrA
VLAYVVLRSLMVGLYLRSYRHVPEARPLIGRYALEYSLAIAIWAASLAFAAPFRYVLWGVAIAWELSIPTLARRLFDAIPVHVSHVPERFALFTIIVLGETIVVVALGTSGSEWEGSAAVVAGLGFVCAAAIWWVYFGGGGEVTMKPGPLEILAFTHVHIPLLAALTAVSAGVALAIEQAPADSLDTGTRWALAGGAALYLVCVTVAQRMTVEGAIRGTSQTRAVGVVALVALALVGGAVAPVVFVGSAAALLVGVVAVKLWIAHTLQQA